MAHGAIFCGLDGVCRGGDAVACLRLLERFDRARRIVRLVAANLKLFNDFLHGRFPRDPTP